MLPFTRNGDLFDPRHSRLADSEAVGVSILIVDDEQGYRDSLKRILGTKGYWIDMASDGGDAIEKLQETHYDIILLDLMMPRVNGHRVLEYLTAQNIDSRIVVLSGTTSLKDVTNVVRRGVHDYLKKPFDPDDLLRTVNMLSRDIKVQRKAVEIQAKLQESEQLHRFIVNNSPDMIFVLDADNRFTYINDRAIGLFGCSPQQLIGRSFLELVAEEERPNANDFLDQLQRRSQEILRSEMLLLKPYLAAPGKSRAETKIPLEIKAMGIFDDSGDSIAAGLQGVYGSARDLSAQKKAEGDLERISARLNHVMDANPAVIYSRPPNAEGPTFVSANVRDLLGFSAGELTSADSPFEELVHPEDIESYRHALKQLNNQPQVSCEYRLKHKDDGWRWIRDTIKLIRDASGHAREMAGSWLDNTEAHLLSEQLSYQASHDPLTGLANRLAFEQRLNGILEAVQTDKSEHALCYLDLDQFKVINDTCGHAAGDSLLRQIAQVLQSRIRRNDMLARLGGDEFGLLMENCSVDNARRVAETLCQEVSQFRFAWMDRIYQIGVSVGVVPIDDTSDTLEGVLSIADSACYVAKDAGRNRVHIYSQDDKELAKRRGEMEWVACINRAFDENRFCLAFQPIVQTTCPDSDDWLHYELLLRLKNKVGLLVMPSEFLPAAERYHLAWRIDHWVVRRAFDWLLRHPHHLERLQLCSINLSGHSLGDERLLEFVSRKLQQSSILRGKICFEITETAAIGNINHAVQFIKTLKDRGVRFALDDFGSGLSSFAYLKQLPVDFLKIDGTFIKGIATDPVSLAMVRSINDIGQVMGMETIAEFVDNRDILDTLQHIGVNYAQGHWIGKPQPIDELAG